MIHLMLVIPDELITAAHHLDFMLSDVGAANLSAAASTTGIAAAAHDEISQSLASLFSDYGQQLHAAVEQTGVTGGQQFANGLTSAASSYSVTDFLNSLGNFIVFLSGPLGNEQQFDSLPLPEQLIELAISWILFPLILPFFLLFLAIAIPLLIIVIAENPI
jgi:PE family